MTQDQRDVTELLTEDHREVENIFGQLEGLPESSHDERRRLTDHAIIDLVRHSVAEEEHLYPAARRYIPDGDQIADREIAEHQEAEQLMKRLEGADATQPQFNQLLSELIQAIRAHVRDEEGDLTDTGTLVVAADLASNEVQARAVWEALFGRCPVCGRGSEETSPNAEAQQGGCWTCCEERS